MPRDAEQSIVLDALKAGAQAAMHHFRKLEAVDRKADNSPVTIADKEAELAIAQVLSDAFPDDGILGEEDGERAGTSGRRWIIDPIDGTRAYARGANHWGPLIALEENNRYLVGAAALPVRDEYYVASRGTGATHNSDPIRASDTVEISECIASLGSLPRLLETTAAHGVIAIARSSAYLYAGNDLEGGLMLARGEADCWLETGVQLWDIAALKVIIEEAGGVFTNFQGNHELATGQVVAAATPELHAQLLDLLHSRA
ncbi:MAG: inositol monophosphatase family protein [Planctomycetota bacterium]|jgi:histidinol-phosphatase